MSLPEAVRSDVQTAVNVVATWGAWRDGNLAEDVLAVLQGLAPGATPADEHAPRIHAAVESLQAALDAGFLDAGGPGGVATALRPRVMEWLAAAGGAGSSPGPELAVQAKELLPAVITASALALDQKISSLSGILASPEPFPDSALCARIARRLPALRDTAGAGEIGDIVGAARDAEGLLQEIEALRSRLLHELSSVREGFAGDEQKAGSPVAALLESAGKAQTVSLGRLAALVRAFQMAAARQESADEATRESAARDRLTTAVEALRQRLSGDVAQDLTPILEVLLAAASEVLDGSPATAMDAWSDSLAAALATLETMDVELQLRESEFAGGQLKRLKNVRQRLAAAAEKGAEPNLTALDQAIGQLEKAVEQQGGSARPALELAATALAAISSDSQEESPEDIRAAIKALEQALADCHGHLSWATFRSLTRLGDELKVQSMDPGARSGLEEKLAHVEEALQRGREEAESSRARLQELQSGALQQLRGEFKAVSSRLSAATRRQIEAGFSKIERTLDDEDDISPEVLAGLEQQIESARWPVERKTFGLGARTLGRWRKRARRKAGKAGAAATVLLEKGQTAAKHLDESLKMGQVAEVEASTGELRRILWQATGGALRRILLAAGLLVILGGGTMATLYYLNQPHQVDLGFDAGDLRGLTAAGGRLILVSVDSGAVQEIDEPIFTTTADDYDLFVSFESLNSRIYVRHIRVPSPAYPSIDLETLTPGG